MKQTAISLNEPLYDWLRDEAKKTGLSMSEIIRRALEAYQSQRKEDSNV